MTALQQWLLDQLASTIIVFVLSLVNTLSNSTKLEIRFRAHFCINNAHHAGILPIWKCLL